jgi:anti-sigma B factor antagonist
MEGPAVTIHDDGPFPARPVDADRPWQSPPSAVVVPAMSPYLTVRQAHLAGTVTLAVAGELDLESAGVLARAIDEEIDGEPVELVVDLSALSFLDAAGAGALIDGHRLADERRIRYRIAGVPRIARRVLEVIGMYTVLTGPGPRQTAYQHTVVFGWSG